MIFVNTSIDKNQYEYISTPAVQYNIKPTKLPQNARYQFG